MRGVLEHRYMTPREWQKISADFPAINDRDIHAVLCIHGFGEGAKVLGKQTVDVFDVCQATIPDAFFGRTCMTADWSEVRTGNTVRNHLYIDLYTDGAMPEQDVGRLWRSVVMTALTGACHAEVNTVWQTEENDRIANKALKEPTRANGQPAGLRHMDGR